MELSDEARRSLGEVMRAQVCDAESVGYAVHGDDPPSRACVAAQIPRMPAGELSVCGQKQFLIDEVRRFTRDDGGAVEVRCVVAAVLQMTDSPVHFHAGTTEFYTVLAGSGAMILGAGPNERVVPVKKGSVVLLPPGQPHGLVADDPEKPITALLTFSPGMAPIEAPEFRDEQIVHPRTSERLLALRSR